MILTGKAKQDFEKWVKNNYAFNDFPISCLKPTLLNALIIEWFDSVGIFIHPQRNCFKIKFNHWYFIITDINGMHLNNFLIDKIDNDSRQEATTKAIEKANEIYNSK